MKIVRLSLWVVVSLWVALLAWLIARSFTAADLASREHATFAWMSMAAVSVFVICFITRQRYRTHDPVTRWLCSVCCAASAMELLLLISVFFNLV